MKWDDFSEFFKERRDFFSTLKNWQTIPLIPATYIFLVSDPLEKVGKMETDIVYIGETVHLGSDPDNCRLWDYETGSGDDEIRRKAFMKRKQKEGYKTMFSWLPCLNKSIAMELEKVLLNAFWSDHGENPPLNRTTPMTRNKTWGISVDEALKIMREMKRQAKVGKDI